MTMVEREHTEFTTSRPYSEADFDGSGAAPLLIVGSRARPQLIHRQDTLAQNFDKVVHHELQGIATDGVVDFTSHAILSRMHQREGLNSIAFMRRRYRFPHPWEAPHRSIGYVLNACRIAPLGEGTADQNHTAHLAFGMPAGEIKQLTIVNDFRKDEEMPMWDEVSELVGADARPRPSDMRAHAVLGFDRDILTNQHVGAVRVGMKRDIGTAPGNIKVKARTTAIINTRPDSGFNQDIIAQLREATYENQKREEIERESKGRVTFDRINLAEIPEFYRALNWLISSDVEPGKVLARNETVYGINLAASERIAQKNSWGLRRLF